MIIQYFLFMCFNKETGERKVEYIKTLSGLNSLKQTLLMKKNVYRI